MATKRWLYTLTAAYAVGILLLALLTSPASADHLVTGCLDVNPETAYEVSHPSQNPDGSYSSHFSTTLTAVRGTPDDSDPGLCDETRPVPDHEPVEIDFEITGLADPEPGEHRVDGEEEEWTTDSNSPETPDASCMLPPDGSGCSIDVEGETDGTGGTSFVRAWIDTDANNETVEADLEEEQYQNRYPGDFAEPDSTDVVTMTWSSGDPCWAFNACSSPCEDDLDNDGDEGVDYDDFDCERSSGRTEATTPECDDSHTSHPSCTAEVLTIRYMRRTGVFKGALVTQKEGCTEGRLIRLRRYRDGRDPVIGRTETNDVGNWRIRGFRGAHGRFYAIATREVLESQEGHTLHECQRMRSVTIKV